jgi:pyrroline-5-carboxylate reductase
MSLTRIGILGLGKMGECLVEKFCAQGFKVLGSVKSADRALNLKKNLQIEVGTDNSLLVKKSDVVVLAVKPHQAQRVLEEIKGGLSPKTLLVSICASLTLDQLNLWSGGHRKLIRAMPNLPALIGEGMTVLSSRLAVDSKEMKSITKIFESVGKVTQIDEALMDGVTALSACGPAFIFLILEALSEAGVKVGIPRKTSVLLAAQTMLGSAKMILDGVNHPAALKDEVTTPAGCTTDGLMALEEGRIRATLIKAVVAAAEKSASLRLPPNLNGIMDKKTF